MKFDWDNPIKREHPNWFLRHYGNLMGRIAHFFLKRAEDYQTVWEIPMEDEDEMWDRNNDIDWEKLQFEYKRWKDDH